MKKIEIRTNFKKMLSDVHTPVGIYLRLRDRFRDTILLESTDYHAAENSYSFICINAIAGIEITDIKNIELKLPGHHPEIEGRIPERDPALCRRRQDTGAFDRAGAQDRRRHVVFPGGHAGRRDRHDADHRGIDRVGDGDGCNRWSNGNVFNTNVTVILPSLAEQLGASVNTTCKKQNIHEL